MLYAGAASGVLTQQAMVENLECALRSKRWVERRLPHHARPRQRCMVASFCLCQRATRLDITVGPGAFSVRVGEAPEKRRALVHATRHKRRQNGGANFAPLSFFFTALQRLLKQMLPAETDTSSAFSIACTDEMGTLSPHLSSPPFCVSAVGMSPDPPDSCSPHSINLATSLHWMIIDDQCENLSLGAECRMTTILSTIRAV